MRLTREWCILAALMMALQNCGAAPSIGLTRLEHERDISHVRAELDQTATTIAARVYELAQQTTLLSVALTNALTECALALGADASVLTNTVPLLAHAIEQEREALTALQRSTMVLIDDGQPTNPIAHTLYSVEWHGSNEWLSVTLPSYADRVQSYYYLVASTNRYALPWREALYDEVATIEPGTNMVVLTTMGRLGLFIQARYLEAKSWQP